jgi:hypothetical protein
VATTRAMVTRASAAWAAARRAAAAPRERGLLRPAPRLCLARAPARVSPGAPHLHDMSSRARAGGLAGRPCGGAARGPPASGSPRHPLGGAHGQPEGANHGSIRWHQGLGWRHTGQGADTAWAGRDARGALVGGGPPGHYLCAGRGTPPPGWAHPVAPPPGTPLGGWLLERRATCHVVCGGRRLAGGEHATDAPRPGVCRATVGRDGGTDAGLLGAAAPLEPRRCA